MHSKTDRTQLSRFFLVALIGLVAFGWLVAGCGKTMSDEDCQHVADHMLEVWNTEANKALSEGKPSERGQAVIRAEGQKLVGEWIAECKQELKGRRVDPDEIDCLMAAKTVESISSCARASQ